MKDQPAKSQANQHAEDEIDLIVLAKNLWNGRKTIIKSVLICAVIGSGDCPALSQTIHCLYYPGSAEHR